MAVVAEIRQALTNFHFRAALLEHPKKGGVRHALHQSKGLQVDLVGVLRPMADEDWLRVILTTLPDHHKLAAISGVFLCKLGHKLLRSLILQDAAATSFRQGCVRDLLRVVGSAPAAPRNL